MVSVAVKHHVYLFFQVNMKFDVSMRPFLFMLHVQKNEFHFPMSTFLIVIIQLHKLGGNLEQSTESSYCLFVVLVIQNITV